MLGLYFSGTGNTKYIMEKLMGKIDANASILSITDELAIEEIKKSEVIYFAYPIQFSNLPMIIRNFIKNHKDLWAGKKIFIICTMGLFSGDGAGLAKRLFKRYKAKVLGGLHLRMPDAVCDSKMLKHSLTENKEIIRKSLIKLDRATEKVKRGKYPKNGVYFFDQIAGLFCQRLYFLNSSMHYAKNVKIDTNKCINCNLCINNCPMHNLVSKEDKVVSLGKCTKCYKCVTNCPKEAITILGKEVIEQVKIDKYL